MDPHRYTFPPAADQRQNPPPPPPPGQWYPPPHQFQYQPPPAPPAQHHWGPPPPPYLAHGQYLPPHPHLPPPPPPQGCRSLHCDLWVTDSSVGNNRSGNRGRLSTSDPPRPLNAGSFTPSDLGNTNWGHHQGWEYPARQDGEDWAAKARAWAESKAATENQQPQLQFTPVSRLEGQSPYHDPYQQTANSYYTDVQSCNPSPGYHQYPPPGVPPQKSSLIYPQEYTATNSGPSSFLPDEHVAYGGKDGRFDGDSNTVYPHQGSSSASSLAHMQEVPSSYSSIPGTVETGDGREKVYKSFPLLTDSSQVPFHDHLPPPPVGRSVLREQPHYSLGNHAPEPPIDLSDQPLHFTRRFTFDQEPMMQQNNNNDRGGPARGVDSVAATSSNHTWTSHLLGTVYPSFPPVFASAQQDEPSLSLTSIPGYPTPFERMSGPNFPTSIPSVGIGATNGIHPTTVFPGDVYGLSGSDRPKKAPVPDWLKEEIIKNKVIIGSSGPERPIDSVEDEAFDKTSGRFDQEDSKSIGSPRSAVEDDEENMEAARTAEVNHEIKRILTEVLLKVTDKLFDEIATQVLEEDLTTRVAEDIVAPEHKPYFAVPTTPTPKASAKVIVASKAKEVETEDDSGKSTSSSPGDLLGLASYASDDDDADNSVQHHPVTKKTSEDDYYTAENGSAQANDRDSDGQEPGNKNSYRDASNGAIVHRDAIEEENFEERKTVETHDTSKPDDSAGEKVIKTETTKDINKKLSAADDSRGRETRNKQDNKDGDTGETRKSYAEIDNVKDGDSCKNRKDGKEDESHRKHVARNVRTETRTDKNNGSKEKIKDQGGKSEEKAKEYDSKKRSSDPDGKTDRKEKERDKRTIDKDDSDRRRDHKKDEKEERSRHKHRSDSSRHRKQRSPSVGNRGRSSKGNSLAGRAKYSSDESSNDSKRELHTRKRNLSRSSSPSRSRKRQDSRSPPIKHSQRRHSPLSSLENTRGKRSRSRSPARQHR